MNKLEPRVFKHTILQGEDDERLRELDAKINHLEGAVRRKVAGAPEELVAALADRNAFAAEAEERGVHVILRSVGRSKWRELIEKNPPRENDADDQKAGINLDTFPEDLVPACITAPTFGEGELDAFLEALTPAQFDTLSLAAWSLHKSSGADPKERRLSAPTGS